MNFCKDCRYSSKRDRSVLFCINPQVSGIDLVTGEPELTSCQMERLAGDKCGQLGLKFEPKYTFKEKFVARLNWWTGKAFDEGALL